MKIHSFRTNRIRGSTLVEAAVSVGVLAVAVPLVFGAIFEAGQSGSYAGLDNRSASIIPACLTAVERAREGKPGWFESSPPGTAFPLHGDTWALGFSEDGRVLGRLTKEQYETGLRDLEGEVVRYLAVLSAVAQPGEAAADSPLRLTIIIEHPAAQSAGSRSRSEFHSTIR
jgi:hypothetical protein